MKPSTKEFRLFVFFAYLSLYHSINPEVMTAPHKIAAVMFMVYVVFSMIELVFGGDDARKQGDVNNAK